MKKLFATCFGLGLLPIAPGTWGSLPCAVLFGILSFAGTSNVIINAVMAVCVVGGSAACVLCAPEAIERTGKKDPGQVVADEFAGQAVTFLALPALAGSNVILAAAAGFLLFRFFDILKPWPIHKLEKLPSGWGILADDLLAGVYACVILQVITRLWLAG
ncbi:MAG: phosphatidylglycerophosphatase A [Phycisphaerae bacterium]|nr:phosphatidylglycerophosphatase A [Phycisphaerae bacterium]